MKLRIFGRGRRTATVDYENTKDRLSAIRNQARMIAGLGYAMGA